MKQCESNRIGSWRRALVGGIAVLVLATSAQHASAQAIVKQLIGNAVDEIGPQYADIEQAVKRFTDGDVAGATEMLESVKAKNPELPPAGVMLASLFALAKNQQAAQGALEKAVQDDPTDPEAYAVFADSAFQQRRFAEAELLYEKAVALSSNYSANPKRKRLLSIRALSGKAGVLETRQKWEEAVAPLQEVVNMTPDSIPIQSRLGRALYKSGKQQEAYKLFQDLYTENKDKIDRAEINMAKLYEADGKTRNAEQLFERALQRAEADDLQTQLSTAQWALETNRIDQARQCLENARKISPDKLPVKLLDGLLARYDKDYAKAQKLFEEAHLMAPSSPIAINQLAVVMVEGDDPEKQQQALAYATLNTRQLNDNSTNANAERDASVTYAWVLYKIGQVIEADRAILQILQSGPPLVGDSSYFAGVILNDRGRTDVAKNVLRSALDPNRKGVFPLREEAEALLKQIDG